MYKIYWTNPETDAASSVNEDDLNETLKLMSRLRELGYTFVTMVSEDPNMVGKQGASIVERGRLPNGEQYKWTKDDRVGAAFKNK
jgi:hypothetical protein